MATPGKMTKVSLIGLEVDNQFRSWKSFSVDVDFGLLVLSRWPWSVNTDLLRGEQDKELCRAQDTYCTYGPFVLPQGTCSAEKGVCFCVLRDVLRSTDIHSSWVRAVGNVVFESDHENGGHFAAIEKPKELADDIRRMFAKKGPAYGAVPGKDGYA